ncbi:hypothetical protein [Pseudomonas putida]|uniref:hypothetical protein n=1 Tax=Pseudomonas putida TaxID=303 RepID=UPI002B24EBBA|nr:hypothetical protein [Pseudomonas putida]
MRNPYAFGFWCLASAILVLATSVVVSAAVGAEDVKELLTAIGAWSTAAQAMTSIILLVLAVLGFNTWKRQIRYEKAMNIIWSMMASLHRVGVGFQRVATELLVSGTKRDFDVVAFLNERTLGGHLKELEEQCVWMDRVVSDNEWEWVNHAETLKTHVIRYLVQYRNVPPCSEFEFVEVMAARSPELQSVMAEFKLESSTMSNKLKTLQKSFSA